MEQWNKRKKPLKIMLLFFVFMWLCTLISKSVFASGLPRVTVKNPEKKNIEHIVEGDGMIKAGGELAIHVRSGLRIQNIFVHRGDIIENGTKLFQIDVTDLQELIEVKEVELAEINYYITDINKNKEIYEQNKQLELSRANEDYQAAVKKSDQLIGHANTVKGEAEKDLNKLKENEPGITSKEDREKAWEKYNNWLAKRKEMDAKLKEILKKVEELEKPNEDGTDKTPEQEAEILAAKESQQKIQNDLTAHENNRVQEPNFSGEDAAKAAWNNSKEALERSISQSEYGQKEAYMAKEDSLRIAQRAIDDIKTPEQSDSALAVYQLKQKQKMEEIKEFKNLLKEGGVICSSTEGIVTRIDIKAGERTSDAAVITFADNSMPYQFTTSFNKEQKKYINQGDKVMLTFPSDENGKKEVEAQIDYLAESITNPGLYEAVVYLPKDEGVIGMSGTLQKKVTGENYNLCIPISALIRENQSSYVYITAKRNGILGEELYVEKVFVTVKDENEKYAALEDGVLTNDSEVIISATDEYEKGSVIRYEE